MIALEVFVQQIADFNSRELLVYFKFRLSSCFLCAMFFFYLPCCWASRKPITSVEFKFVARQVEASVVIRAANLKFVAESRTRVYFAQHAIPGTKLDRKFQWSFFYARLSRLPSTYINFGSFLVGM